MKPRKLASLARTERPMRWAVLWHGVAHGRFATRAEARDEAAIILDGVRGRVVRACPVALQRARAAARKGQR